ncbi:hypothetical protein BGZ81_004880 [Podila clonocystis]|nr:hypothetical protein BGZ81_004880 [Podila clonocystis]
MPGKYLKHENGVETLNYSCRVAGDVTVNNISWDLDSTLGKIMLVSTRVGDSFWVQENGTFPIGFCLSTEDAMSTPSKPLDPTPTLADLMMERLYYDKATRDVVFINGEKPTDAESQTDVSESEETFPDVPVDKRQLENQKEVDNKEHPDTSEDLKDDGVSEGQAASENVTNGGAKCPEGKSQEKPKERQVGSEGAATGEGDESEEESDEEDGEGEEEEEEEEDGMEEEDLVQEKQVGAHKMVLLHWPFFKKMIETNGGRDFSDSGEMRLYISGVEWPAFEVLIRFLYTGRIPLRLEPKLVFANDHHEGDRDASWEEVFLAADHCEIDELRELALAAILSKLTPEGTIPFLFRTAYLHKDLRAPVVKYVATTCGAEISKKSVQKEYTDHAECVELFGEIITAFHKLARDLA